MARRPATKTVGLSKRQPPGRGEQGEAGGTGGRAEANKEQASLPHGAEGQRGARDQVSGREG